jgi:DNA-binding SARP family transcriptional activator
MTRRLVRGLRSLLFGIPADTTTAPPCAAPPPAPASPARTVASPPPEVVSTDVTGPADEPPTGEDVPAGEPARPSPGRVVELPVVELPDGGWVTGETATAIASMAALVWLQRRRRYLPRPPTAATRDDADLIPLPDTVAAVQDELCHRHNGDEAAGEDDPSPSPIAVAVQDQVAATTATVGEQGGGPVRPDALPPGGVGLTGAGAAAAARGLLVAVLLSGHPVAPRARLVITAADLQTLLGAGAADRHRGTPGLTVTDDLDAAVAHLERAAVDRHRARFTQATRDPTGAGGLEAGPPPLMLVTGCPADPATARRLAILLAGAAPLRITGVVLGDWDHGTSWQVDPDGAVHPADPPHPGGLRLSVLTSTATTDLLGLFREARSARTPPAAAPIPSPRRPGDEGDGPTVAGQHHDDAPAAVTASTSGHPPVKPRLRLRVLGAPSIHDAGATGAALHLRRSAAVQLLVFLAVHRDGATTGQLAAALWPGLRPHVAVDRFHTPHSSLRTALRRAAGVHVLVRDGDRYRLDDQHLDVDLWRLHAAVNDAATALDPADRQRALQAAGDAYTGDLAAGRHWPWLAAPREAARRHAIDAYATLAALQPDPQSALASLQNAIRIDPCNEELHRQAMRGYAAIGDSPTARRLLAAFTSRLAEMGLETSAPAQ